MRLCRIKTALSIIASSLAVAINWNAIASTGCQDDSKILGHVSIPNCVGIDYFSASEPIVFRTNKMGLRGPDFPEWPVKGKFRILLVGSSGPLTQKENEGQVAEVQKALKDLKFTFKNKKYNGVEVINAAESSYHAVKTYLRLPSLMTAYNPHMVILPELYGSLAPEEYSDHYYSRKNNRGFAVAIGESGRFWPLPAKWDVWAWQNFKNPFYYYSISRAIKIVLVKIKLDLEGLIPWTKAEIPSPSILHFKYLEEIERIVGARGAEFHVMFAGAKLNNNFDDSVDAPWNAPSLYYRKFYPRKFLSKGEADKYEQVLRNWTNRAIDFSVEMEQVYNEERLRGEKTIHLSQEASDLLGKKMAAKIRSILIAEKEDRKK